MEAVIKLQAKSRGYLVKQKVKDKGASVKHRMAESATQSKESADEYLIQMKWIAATKAFETGLSSGIRSVVASDPWLPNSFAQFIREPVLALIKEVAMRAKHGQLEAVGKGSWALRRTLANQLDPRNWPPPPLRAQPFTWLRARFLYAIHPADKSLSYRAFHEPWMLALLALLFAPPLVPFLGISLVLWVFYFYCVFRCHDEYQLFNWIAMFKTWAFVMRGIAPILGDFFLFYYYLSSHAEDSTLLDDPGLLFSYHLFCSRAFLVLWLLCYLMYWRYLQVRKVHYTEGSVTRNSIAEEVAGTRVHTGDQDTGNREQDFLMRYDVAVLGAHCVLGFADLKLRLHSSIEETLFAPDSSTMLFESFLVTSLSIFAAPFALWKLPVVGELFHQMRPTAFDQAGDLRLHMSLAEMRKKKTREEKTKRYLLSIRKGKGRAAAVAPEQPPGGTERPGVPFPEPTVLPPPKAKTVPFPAPLTPSKSNSGQMRQLASSAKTASTSSKELELV